MSTIKVGWDAFANPVPADVLACLTELGVKGLYQRDDEVHGLCPAHFERTGKNDRHSSWSVNADSGIHNCFSCGWSGNFVQLAEYLLPKDEDAVAWVRKRGGIERARKILDRKKSATIEELTSEEYNEAHLALFTEPPTWALEERRLTGDAARYFGVLWDPKRDAWIIPIREPYSHRLLGYQYKSKRFFSNRPDDVPKSKTLFGFDEHAGDRVILVESPLDCVRLLAAGVPGAVASYGVQVSAEQMRLVLGLAERVVIALDNDKDGRKISSEIKKQYAHRARMSFLTYEHTDAKDVGAMRDDEIRYALRHAVPSMLARF